MSLFKTNDYSKAKCVRTVYVCGKEQSKENIKKDRIIRDFRTPFKQGNDYYIPIRVGNIWNNNYIKYESSSNRNKNLPVKDYLDETKPWSIPINFIFPKDIDEERVMH